MKTILLISFLSFSILSIGQNDLGCDANLESINGAKIYSVVETPAEYIGGMAKFQSDLFKELNYPKDQKVLQTSVMVQLILDDSGNVRNACVLRPMFDDKFTLFEIESVRVVKQLNNWAPAQHKGENVPLKITFPIRVHFE